MFPGALVNAPVEVLQVANSLPAGEVSRLLAAAVALNAELGGVDDAWLSAVLNTVSSSIGADASRAMLASQADAIDAVEHPASILRRVGDQLRDEAFDSVASEVADEVLSLVLGERLQRESAGAHEVGSQQRPSESRADAFTVKRSESPAAADRSLRCAEPQPDLTKAKACPQPAIAAAVTEQGRHGVTGSAMPISTPAHSGVHTVTERSPVSGNSANESANCDDTLHTSQGYALKRTVARYPIDDLLTPLAQRVLRGP
jgi:hypothetical protein